MSRRNLRAPTNGFLIYKPSEASASIIHLYCERVLPARARTERCTEFRETAGFSGDRTGSSAESPTRASAVNLVIGVPSQRGSGEDAGAAERIIRLLMIFQNQHGGGGMASGGKERAAAPPFRPERNLLGKQPL